MGVRVSARPGRLLVPADRVRLVRRFDPLDVLVGQGHLQRAERVLQVFEFRRADDRCGDARLTQQPGQRHLGRLDALVRSHVVDRLHHGEVVVGVEGVAELVVVRAYRALLAATATVAGEQTAGQRAPRDHAHPGGQAVRDHLPLLLAVHQVVVVLHRHEPRPAVRLRGVLHRGELPGVHAGRAEVAGLAGAYHVVQRLHGLLDRRLGVEPVDLIQIHVVGPEPAQRVVDGGEDVLAGQATVVRALTHHTVHLGGHYIVVTVTEQLAEQAAGDLFADPGRVHVRGVEERDAALDGTAHDRFGFRFVQCPRAPRLVAVAHHAQTDPGDLQAGRTQSHIVHAPILPRQPPRGDPKPATEQLRWPLAARASTPTERP